MKRNIWILLLFTVLTVFMTYPLVLHMHEAVEEPGDTLFITWTILWDIKALLNNPLNIFHANIFYPYKYTLAYSEHMIGVGLLALPVYYFIQNPLFIYNFMLLLSFVLCGFGAYLLTYYLTKDILAGIIAGIIFTFCPYRFDQLGHLHVLTCQWMPFALLFLHKIVYSRQNLEHQRHLPLLSFCFGFFLFLQFLCSGHNGLYLSIAVILFLLYFRKQVGLYPWVVLGIVCVLLLPFYYPYFYLAKEFGFTRPASEFKLYSPCLSAYLAAQEGNLLYGKILGKFCKPEAVMFPGILALVLALWAYIPKFKFKKFECNCSKSIKIINVLILLDVLIILTIMFTGGIDFGRSFFGIQLKVSDYTRPIYLLIFLIILKMVVNWKETVPRIRNIFGKLCLNKGVEQFYWTLLIVSFILSFGPEIRTADKDVMWGPYSLLYNFLPGFNGIRSAGRIYVFFILALSVLAGFGVKKLKEKFGKKIRYILFIIPAAIIVEYINIPYPLNCWIGVKPPSVYEWVAKQPADSVIMELPMPEYYDKFSHEIQYVYWSIFHGKKMVNGYSGYFPPEYWVVARKMKGFPDDDTIVILRRLGVRYIVVHEDEIEKWGWPSICKKMDRHKGVFPLRFTDGKDYIYELTGDN